MQSLHNQRRSLQERRATAENYRLEAYERIGAGLTDAQQTLADQHFRLPDDCPPERLNQHERHQRERLEKARAALNDVRPQWRLRQAHWHSRLLAQASLLG